MREEVGQLRVHILVLITKSNRTSGTFPKLPICVPEHLRHLAQLVIMKVASSFLLSGYDFGPCLGEFFCLAEQSRLSLLHIRGGF